MMDEKNNIEQYTIFRKPKVFSDARKLSFFDRIRLLFKKSQWMLDMYSGNFYSFKEMDGRVYIIDENKKYDIGRC